MLGLHVKKLAIIGNISMAVTYSREDVKKVSNVKDLEIVKCITWNIKLNKCNEEVFALLNLGSRAQVDSQAYTA